MTAVVVSWNGAHLLSSCLRALLAQEVRAELRVVVVDNGSTDGTAAQLAREFPAVEALLLPENLGFGRANNEALRRALQAGATHVALVNNDVEVEPGWLSALLDASAAHPEAGLFCGTLLFRGEERVNSTGIELDHFGRARDRDFGLPLERLQREDGPVAGITAGAALLRADGLRRIGLFDPAYFAYYEDVDLSLRARAAGIGCRYVAAARARHRFSATFGRNSARQRALLGEGHLRTLASHQPLLRAFALVPAVAAFRLAVKAPLELARARPGLALAELRAAVNGLASALPVLWSRLLRR